jgi:excisionase family DNA binding protein
VTTTNMPTGWLTLREAAEYARCSTVTIRREVRAGRLRAFRLAGRRTWRLRATDVDRWILGGSADEPVVYTAPRPDANGST